ncbi:DsbA-like protein [Aeromicrobium marinum DSM 15272]|uniref:DsbA-like protein n=1 Tax=Aeromicrobium marinum DSM 15272 TaxID=585531 RepID=E2SFP0_9ACTN|nr:thioredoxin domain-containing protein [Aeromicrobium marinum]EFQ82007.1 DsbA-like protein [Aeromicrobium marinum DSM 15272]
MNKTSTTRRTVITAALVTLSLAALGVFVALEMRDKPPVVESSGIADPRLFRADSHVIQDAPEGSPVLVEFLDFECEACGALYPAIEQLRQDFDGQIEFVVRYFPLPGHVNSRNAAHAAEAAARQGAFEPMYRMLFETQTSWGESQDDQSAVFRGFAEDLGLDLAQYDRDVTSEDVAARVESDFQDALSLGLTGTPSLFLDGEILQPRTLDDFTDALESAAANG